MSSRDELISQQRQWAESEGLAPDARGYLASVDDNLLRPLAPQTKLAFDSGSGSELLDTPTRPAKMKALHSSSALAVNFFDSWVGKDASPLASILGLDSEIASIKFEEQFPTGLTGNPPNLDVALELASGDVVAIESKYSEWLSPKSKSKTPFKTKYFPNEFGLWEAQRLPRSQELSVAIKNGEALFRYLDAPQLLKHALGLATRLDDRFSLYYIYYDWPGKESELHREELIHFTDAVGPELRFKAVSYQDLFCSLEGLDSIDNDYRHYLRARYFPDKSRASHED